MKLSFQSGEPDGRLYIEDENYIVILTIHTDAIDPLIEMLKKHIHSEGDGQPFFVDTCTGESGLL
jgi:hypothetical protein